MYEHEYEGFWIRIGAAIIDSTLTMIPLFIGIIRAGIDKRKQGWHDKLAATVVIISNIPGPVKFDNQI